MSIGIERVGHVVLNVRDLERSVAFYRGVLGLREVGRYRGKMAAKAHLEAAGVEIRRIESHRVSRSIYLADPDGNELELYVDDDPEIWRSDPSAVASVEPFEL